MPLILDQGCFVSESRFHRLAQNIKQGSRREREQKPLINDKIGFNEFILIDENGSNLGTVRRTDALKMAEEKQLDLVLIGSNPAKPIVKLLDFGRYTYDLKRKKRQSKKNQTIIQIKEVVVKPTIAKHDLEFKAKQTTGWAEKGYHVKFVVRAFGRVSTRIELIEKVFNDFYLLVEPAVEVQKPLTASSKTMYSALLIPRKK
ncbi:translation initiation factor IF-3 [Mycoplasmoides pneumoniae]|uniref:Translation initiation factor IF-3 n=3 Tax=Mycoplasmoides pneumoniae TaxID=2104 RepID=A0AB38W895_MYCPM|nr:translation initiation factor IF-3 [Mycoplasmoides pneumoniae]ADK87212.1 translation initiation factor IF-3 [Mycoplasmoides pneumoniae FH]ALA30962.1 translation initiation factor IF-3 [Mycoplasmoides pneumoniae 19294]ALA31399.1 translation initiation factor IF-3 [Mycoplasmoides pneumoniae 39443]ALA36339.1 translation initiation factor IF-3 [Mycoplasmoides pneumoniae M1139]ALA37750.1 translation initiation factor IF-3 [Mycoplasmoides pneumoniae M2592]ALA38456.1 translation initiation factor